MKLSPLLYGLENKVVSTHELQRYFDVSSLDELILTLRQYARENYFSFEVTLSSEYLKWEDSHKKVLFLTDILKPIDPFGSLQRSTYRLDFLYPKIKSKVALSDTDIIAVVKGLPSDMATQYLRFKLSNINRTKLREIIAAQPKEPHSTEKDEEYETLTYGRLAAMGAEITYMDKPVHMGFQQRQVVRVFLKKPEKLRTKDVFTTNRDIFPQTSYPDVVKTLGKLVPEVHRILRKAVGEKCIFNTPKEGWSLKIE